MPNEVYPSLAFDNLFENRGSLRNMSILDRVKDDAEALSREDQLQRQGQAGRISDQRARSGEARRGMRKNKDKAEDLAKQKNRRRLHDGPARERPAGRSARPHAADVRHHRDRVPDRQDARGYADCWRAIFRRCTIRSWKSEGHHAASHNNNSDGYERIARFHLSQFAYLATKLDSMPEGDGTVLDNSCLMFLSNMWIGRKHDKSGCRWCWPAAWAAR